MIYEALVIDNSKFVETGTIRVRIKNLTITPSMMKDLSENPTQSIDVLGGQKWLQTEKEKKFVYTDTDVRVSSAIGGGYDYGLFYLPQPNSWGIVAQIGDPWNTNTRNNYVWLGSLYQRDIITKSINVPSENLDGHNGIEGDGEKAVANITNVNSAIVLKTKTTSIAGGAENIDQDKSRESLNFKKRPTENLIVIDKDKVRVIHNVFSIEENSKDGGENWENEEKIIATETLNIDGDGIIINYSDKENNKNSFISLDNKGNFKIQKEADDANISFSGDANGINIDYLDNNNDGANINIGKKSGTSAGNNKAEINISAFEAGKTTCSISVKSNGINIESPESVNISSAKNVTLGNLGLPVLCSPTGGDIEVGNVTLPCSKKVLG